MLPSPSSWDNIDFVSGSLLLVDKPKGWTSFDAVNKIKNLIRHKFNLKKIKVGHSGTLDPMATGLLVICTGAWTKELHQLLGLDKKYSGEITLGIETDSYDAEGKTVTEQAVPVISIAEINTMLQTFTGEIEQVPPIFSALKKEGKPLYALARAGKEVKPDARKVVLHSIMATHYSNNRITLDIHCGSGFYVRSLAHDLGAMLGCGAHLSALTRTAIGPYELRDAKSMEEIVEMFK